jgi:hypothetical protein
MNSFQIKNPTFGSDFEMPLFLDNMPKSIVGLLGGTKEEPISIGNGCFKQEDNVNAEFNIPPVDNIEDFVSYIDYCINYANAELHPYHLEALSALEYPQEELNSRQAKTFGCSSSYNAYTMDIMPSPNAKKNPALRSAGFHIHVGFKFNAHKDNLELDDLGRFIRLMDKNIGLYTLEVDPDRIRRNLYGKAGDFRYKSIDKGEGEYIVIVEYRSIGSYLLNNEKYIREVFNRTLQSIEDFNNGLDGDKANEEIINNYQVDKIKTTTNAEASRSIGAIAG